MLCGCRVHSPENNYFIQDKLIVEGTTTVEAVPRGGDMVLLKLMHEENSVESVKEIKSIMKNLFLSNLKMVIIGSAKRKMKGINLLKIFFYN